eukprot:evm.model.scf_12EXC.15 EVM.evm.TU.scf_12EXC.15   scf_12EXC:135630-140885(+)
MAASAWAALALMICVACRGVWASGGGASGSQVAENGINWEDAAALQRQLLIACLTAEVRDWMHMVVGQVVQVETSIMHPMYTGDLLNGYDVALLKLSEASEKSFPVLPEKDDDTLSSENLVVLGWGQQRDGTMADFLQMADEVDIIPPVLCTSSDSWGSFIDPDQMICAMGFQGQDVCTGDGGGPLVSAFAPEGVIEDGVPVVDIVLGVVSFAEADKACGEQKLPTVFARLSGVREWIVSTMATR